MQFATGQHWFEHIASIHGPFCRARADDGMHFIDEENDFSLGIGYFFKGCFEAFLKFAAIFRASDECAHVELHQALVFQPFGYIPIDDALCQTFHNGGLANPRFANQRRIVFGAARKNFNRAADFVITPDHRVQLALTGKSGDVASVFFQSLVGVFRVLAGDGLAAADAA